MNTPNAYLWDLIKSMAPAEKRYYKTHFAINSSQHTLLFDELNEQSTFDDASIKKELNVSADQYKVLKAQLYDTIIKSLIAQKGKRDLKSRIRLGLEEVDLLLEREQHKTATKKLKALAKSSKKNGFTLYQYEITERLHEIQHLESDFSDPATHHYYDQLLHLQAILDQKQALSGIQVKLSAWTPFMPNRHHAIKQLLLQLKKMRGEYLDFNNYLMWFQCMASCLELLGFLEEPMNIREQILLIFEQNKNLQNEHPLSYLNALKQAANPNLNHPNTKRVQGLTQKAERIIAVHPQYTPHYIYFLWARLQAYYFQHQWTPIIQKIDKSCMSYIEKYQLEGIHTTTKILVILATTHLINEQYERAEALLKLFRKNQALKDKALTLSVNILELCLYWEGKKIEELIQSLSRFKRQQKQNKDVAYSNIYNIHLDLFADLIKTPFLISEKAGETLLRVSEQPYDPILDYYSLFNLERWVQASAVRKKWKNIITPVH